MASGHGIDTEPQDTSANDVERECVAALLRGGVSAERALATLIRRYQPRILAWARRRGLHFADAEEVAQDVFLRLANRCGRIAEIENVAAYLFEVAQNLITDKLRSRHRYERGIVRSTGNDDADHNLLEPTVDEQSPEQRVSRAEYADCMERAWALFSQSHPRKAMAIDLAACSDLPGTAIWRVFGSKSYGGWRQHLSAARENFYRLLLEHCGPWPGTEAVAGHG